MTETTLIAQTATPNLNKALSLLQGELPRITKTKTGKVEGQNKAGKFFSYDYAYADLGDVVADVGPLLAKHGLAFHCGPTRDPADRRQMILVWSLLHESGEEKTGEWPLGAADQKPQSLGSAITYGRRYCFTAATNIVLEDDDDGQRAQQDHGSRQTAADAFENAAPTRPRQSTADTPPRGQVSRPAAPVAAVPAIPAEAEDADVDAQAYADEAHGALTPRDLEDIQRRAREAGKLSALVRNPSSDGTGKPGKLAVYLDWKRKQIKEAGDALTDLGAQAAERGITNLEDWFKGEMRADIETASAAHLREAVRLLPKTAAAA